MVAADAASGTKSPHDSSRSDPRRRSPDGALHHRRRRGGGGAGRLPGRGQGRVPGRGRRIRLRQEPDLHGGDGSDGPERQGDRLGPISRPGAAGGEARRAEQDSRLEDDHDLPGSAHRADPARAHRRTDRRAAAAAPGDERQGRHGSRQAVAGKGADTRRRSPPAPISARAFRRHAPAGDDRPGDGVQPGPADRRRADHRPRCHRAGRDPRPDGRAEGRDRRGDGADHPRHGGDRPAGRPGLRDEGRALCRGGRGGLAVRQSADALYPLASRRDSAPGPSRPWRPTDHPAGGAGSAGGGHRRRREGVVPGPPRPVRGPEGAARRRWGQLRHPPGRDPGRGRRKRLRQDHPIASGAEPDPGQRRGGDGAGPRHYQGRPGVDARGAQGPADRLPGSAGQPRSPGHHRRLHRRAAAGVPPAA